MPYPNRTLIADSISAKDSLVAVERLVPNYIPTQLDSPVVTKAEPPSSV